MLLNMLLLVLPISSIIDDASLLLSIDIQFTELTRIQLHFWNNVRQSLSAINLPFMHKYELQLRCNKDFHVVFQSV